MTRFLIRFLVAAFALWLAATIVPGISVTGLGSLLAAAFLFGLVNAFVRPVVVVLTLPLTILTLGLFLLVINAAMLGLVGWLLGGFNVDGFVPALLGVLVISVISWIAGRFIDRT